MSHLFGSCNGALSTECLLVHYGYYRGIVAVYKLVVPEYRLFATAVFWTN